jgi:hypothetical protein
MAGTPGKDGKVVSFEERMANTNDPAEKLRWSELIRRVQQDELNLTNKYLREAFDSLNADLGNNEKHKGKTSDLAAKVVSMSKVAGGLFRAYASKCILIGEMLEPNTTKDPVMCAIEARYRIQHQSIVLGSLERKEIK